jgi:predicted helicase
VPEDGIVAFITGRKPLSKTAYDGFRKIIARDFAEIWIMDLGGDVRDNTKLSGTKHNVFGIQIGVAIWFLVRRKGGAGPAIIRYARRPEAETATDKLSFLSGHSLRDLTVEVLQPDKRNAWIEQAGDAWASLPALVSRDAKADQAAPTRSARSSHEAWPRRGTNGSTMTAPRR